MTNYAGIDYSGPGSTANRDVETGIRYGMISQHSVMPEALDDVYSKGDDLQHEQMKEDMQESIAAGITAAVEQYGGTVADPDELAAEIMGVVEFDNCCDESGPYAYESDGLKVQTTSDNELWVFKSPFYTRAQFCSPCVPGAGNLDTFCEDGPKTYCLGTDWFEGDKAPYNIWSVETDELVYAMPGYFGGEVDDKGLPV
jgi:hypothetical protein